ncbi:MAG: helix-turn-helix transcriptional regulator [Oscillospiraceae bacterium]|nr:helix-turn-helix transcriptional regulator [Oscillospiraceae bacterium]
MEKRYDGELVRARFDKLRHINIHINFINFFSMHEHDCLELVIVLKGNGKIDSDQGQFSIGPGDILLRNFYDPHEMATTSPEPLSTLCVQLSANFCRDYFSHLRNLRFETGALHTLSSTDLQNIHDLATGAAQDFFKEEPGYQLACVGKLSLLLALLITKLPYEVTQSEEYISTRSRGDRKRRIINYINLHFKEKITLESLAATEHVTPTHLCHFFKETFGLSFREYLNKVRLEKAMVLLQDPRLYLVDVCMETGFSDSRYLNTVFEKAFGYSVAEYRRRYLSSARADSSLRQGGSDGGRYSRQECIRMIDEHIAAGGFRY